MLIFNLLLSSFTKSLPNVASNSCSWMIGVEPDVVFCCNRSSAQRCDMLSILLRFSVFCSYFYFFRDTVAFLSAQTSLSILMLPTEFYCNCTYSPADSPLTRTLTEALHLCLRHFIHCAAT